MAQASGLMNVVRQVGGSFGVAILQTLLAQRIVYHAAISGAAIDPTSPVFKRSIQMLATHVIRDAGATMQNAMTQGSLLLTSYFQQQVFVFALNDAFLFSCACTAICTIPVLMLRTRSKGLHT